jgi:hypothetical protein
VRKDVISREPDHDSPTADGDAATTIGEFDKPSDESKARSTRSHTIDGGDVTDKDAMKDIDKFTNEQLAHAPEVKGIAYTTMKGLNGGADVAEAEDAAHIQPRKGLHKSRGVIKVCGWAIHGIFCCCSGKNIVTQLMPRYATVTNLNVPRVLPIRPIKSDEIKQEECDKFYEPTADNEYEFGFPVNGIAYFARQIEAMMRQTLEVEADTMTDEEEEEPHHAALGPGVADDQPAPCDQHLSQDEELHQAALGPGTPIVLQEHQTSQDEELYHAAPGPGKDDLPAQQDQQPSNITCNITQPATIPAAVARLVLNPVGYNVNVPPSHLTTQVQPSPSPRPEQENTHKMSATYEITNEEDLEKQQTLHVNHA